MWTLLLITAAIGAVYLLLALLEPAMIYHPSPEQEPTPADLGMRFEDVVFETADGERLRGWWLPPGGAGDGEGPLPALLFFHGNAGTRVNRLHNLGLLYREGLGVFIFDYRGYGGSSGSPSEQGLISDGVAAFDWLAGRAAGRPIVLFGRSLGAAVAAQVALLRPARGLIMESAFTSVPAMAKHVLPLPGISRLVRTGFDNRKALAELDLPLLFIHGEQDELVPFQMGRELFEQARSPRKVFHAVPEGRHNDTYIAAGPDYIRRVVSFLESISGRGSTGIPD